MSYNSPTIFHAPFERLSYFIAFTVEGLVRTLDEQGFSIYGLPYRDYEEGEGAVTFQKWEDGMRINAVFMNIPQTAKCHESNIGMIVHESIHVVEDILDRMEERNASEEFRAYLTQEVCSNLIGEFLTYIGVGR